MLPDFADRRQARIDRLRARADKARAAAESAHSEARSIAAYIPPGQPILVGHHSEKRHRRDLDRIARKEIRSIAETRKADELERRARAAESNTAIDSDDPKALDKLREKLARLEESHAAMKRWTTEYRKGRRRGLNHHDAMLATNTPEPLRTRLANDDFLKRLSKPQPFFLSNSSAEIRRVKKRIEELESAATRSAPTDETIGEVTISEQDNRVRIRFPDKPSAEVRRELRSNGFRWSPSAEAWQRKPSSQAWEIARTIAMEVADVA